MPFPWKEVRSTRISRLVNNHLQNSQKRRGDSSLVVETGFPTSLIDLFIKNREKLKNASKKKRARHTAIALDDSNDPVISGSLSTSCPSSLRSPALYRSPSPLPLPLPPRSRNLDEIVVVDADNGDFGGRGDERGSGVKWGVEKIRVFVAVVKICLAVVLAMGTEKLTMGITMSAFFLFLLEYVGKHSCGLLKPCSEAKEVQRLMVQSVWRFFRFKVDKSDRKNAGVLGYEVLQDESFNPGCSGLKKDCGLSSPIRETQNVEPKRLSIAIAEEIRRDKEMMDESSHDGKLGYEELEFKKVIIEKEESISERLELKERKSRRAKMKSKIKKFVSKKLRRRKEHNSESSEVRPIVEDNNAICEEQVTCECEDEFKPESSYKSSSLSSERDIHNDFVNAKCFSDKSLEANGKKTLVGEEARTEAGQNSRYLVLCLIVLIGLIGGRIFALMLALLWCLLLKSGKTLQRLVKLPMIRSFSDQSS